MAKPTQEQFNKVENPRTQTRQKKGGGKMATEIKKISLPKEAYEATYQQFEASGKLDDFHNMYRMKGSAAGFAGDIATDYKKELEELQKGVDELNKKMVADNYTNNKGVQGAIRLQGCAVSNFNQVEKEHLRTATGYDKFEKKETDK